MTAGALDLLALAREGDEAAAARVLEENSGLIWAVVRRYYGKGVEPDDLYQLGCLGFLKAVRGFDVSYGTQFSTYAVPKIAGEIRRFLRDDGAVKVSRGTKERAMALRQRRLELSQRLGREPTVGELAAATGLEPEDIAAADTAAVTERVIITAAGMQHTRIQTATAHTAVMITIITAADMAHIIMRAASVHMQICSAEALF